MKKKKIEEQEVYELIIEENDDISGIQSVSLVTEPAIEVYWVAFNKENQLFFDIPDGEDSKYASHFEGRGESEQDLFDDGWVIQSMKPINYEEFALTTKPNSDSSEDGENFRVRYKYGLHPKISGQPYIIPTSREYCRTIVGKNLVFRKEDIMSLNPNNDSTDGGSGGAPYRWRGGYNCRHFWWEITYKKEGKIVNNSTVNINKIVDSAGREISVVPPWDQPSTVTESSKGTLNYAKEISFQVQDDEKHIVMGPAMIPNLEMPRKRDNGDIYKVFFSEETIRMISEKYFKMKLIDNNDVQHTGEPVPDVFVIESWIKESNDDKSNKYGFSDLPIGTWFISMKVNNPEVWKLVKDGTLKGFSVSGFFAEEPMITPEEEFLQELANLVKRY